MIYYLVFYAVSFFGTGCTYSFDEAILGGALPCSFTNIALSTFDVSAHAILPRAVWQKYYARGRIQWRQHHKLAIQVFVISSIYLIFTFPYACTNLMILFGSSTFEIGAYTTYAAYASYTTFAAASQC